MGMKVTGLGLICGLGNAPDTVFNNMCAGMDVFKPIYSFDASAYAQSRGGQIAPEEDERLALDFPEVDRALAMARTAALQALGGSVVPEPRRALVLATNFGPMETMQWAWRERLDTGELDEYTFAPARDYIAGMASALGCGGPAQQISVSCASGAAALAAARDLLASGRADSVLVVAYDSLSEYSWCGLSNLHTITTDVMRPFDSGRSGTIFSEGAAAMLLEKENGAAPARAWINGTATGNNAFHITAPRKNGEGSRQVMEAAMATAGVTPGDISHICAHATSTRANDSTEAAAIHGIFGENTPTVGAHKSQLGHLLGAAGLAEAVVTVLAMERSMIPPTINHVNPDPECMPLDCIPRVARTKNIDTALTNSAGIGGNNAAVVISRRNGPSFSRKSGSVFYLRNMGWVLPENTGSGKALLENPGWLEYREDKNAMLDSFNSKDYISSVKGYLDPASGYFLSACRLAAGDSGDSAQERRGISSGTFYGSSKSAYTFYSQLVQKGARLASPMIFPHGYSNTPGNLAAIDLGYAGPHIVFYGVQDVTAPLLFALERLMDGTAAEMLCGYYEALYRPAFPESIRALNGAVVLNIAAEPSGSELCSFTMEHVIRQSAAAEAPGCLCALGGILGGCFPGV